MHTYRLEFESMVTHKDGGVMGTKHLILIEAQTADEALIEARRRFGSIGDLNGTAFKLLRPKERDYHTARRPGFPRFF